MSQHDPEIEPADLEERIYQGLRQACDGDLRRMAKLLASKPYKQLLGQTEFEVRDLAHDLGARACTALCSLGAVWADQNRVRSRSS